jgi:hypothetical protein
VVPVRLGPKSRRNARNAGRIAAHEKRTSALRARICGKPARTRMRLTGALDLDGQIRDAETAIESSTTKEAFKAADPQRENLAAAAGVPEAFIALISHLFFAIAVEVGSGFRAWIVLGHGFLS